jgi:hypothetical protein
MLAGAVVLKDAKGLLVLWKKSANCYAELGPGLKHPDARDPEGEVLPVSGFDKPVQDRVIKRTPPCAIVNRPVIYQTVLRFEPIGRDIDLRPDKIGSHLRASGQKQEEEDQDHAI